MKAITYLLSALATFYPAFLMAQYTNRSDTVSGTLSGTSENLRPSENVLKAPENFPVVIDAVLHDFPDNFRHITGDLILAEGEIENYASTISLPGSASCVITRYHSKEDTTASWQARMYQGDHFSEASRLYGELYTKLKSCTLQLADGGLVYLKGEWQAAKEEAPFTTSTLKLMTSDQRYQYLKIEVELVYLLNDWVININIMSKRPDNEVGG